MLGGTSQVQLTGLANNTNNQIKPMRTDHIKRLITFTMITLSDTHLTEDFAQYSEWHFEMLGGTSQVL
jgi:hypothetical protein